ncbi:hypothetical protein ACFQ21_07680 [Ohtaekwangia kribbensis]|jgi:hypothetical protein|uniref:Uncharacterized protein n=1 Tax=Ohtaekwangia kribbensis TaxID=688913 RepID=A0ABW3JYX7_9BACT
MDPKFYSSFNNQVYVSLWNKYRPAILQLMIASESSPQEYTLSGHEFKTLNPKDRNGYSFTLQAHQGKALNNIQKSVTAQDLLYMLSLSPKACELMDAGKYEFTLTKQFKLLITKLQDA